MQSGKNLNRLTCTSSINKVTLCLLVSALCSLFNAVLFASLCFLLMILLFKNYPKCSAEMLSSILKHKVDVVCPMEKIYKLSIF